MKKIECVILDWAGTAVDYGCFAPVSAFIESFRTIGLEVTAAETRAHMGLTKIEEIRALFRIERVAEEFHAKYGRDYNESDVQACYAEFQRLLFSTLRSYSGPISKVVETIDTLREQGIKIGSTTGYTRQMMDRFAGKGKPVFLAGDMNEQPADPAISKLKENWSMSSTNAPTYPSDSPKTCIDIIFLMDNSGKCTVAGAGVGNRFTSGNVAVASDHLPVYVDIMLSE